jgi:RNA recognition motif-containing protein
MMGEPGGEDAWVGLVDEASRTARDLDQRVQVVELYKKAVNAEPFSLRLWLQYCEWMWSLHVDSQSGDAGWPIEEQQAGQELFGLQTCIELWQQGAHAVRYRLNDSHVLWNRYMSVELEELAKYPTPPAIDRVKNLYLERLQIPHATWDETSQAFSQFMSRYDQAHYEDVMTKATQLAKHAKDIYSHREINELNLARAIQERDIDKIRTTVTAYIEWEIIQSRKKNGIPALLFALFERCLLLLPTNALLWEDYVSAVIGYIHGSERHPHDAPDLLELLQRSVRHCPSSGSLWSAYMLRAEVQNFDFHDVERIKHAATASGQLDRNGMGDVLKVYSAWCNYLRRRAITHHSTDEDIDLADVGMPSALESVIHWGQRLYGRDWKGDPSFQIQRCWIQYLTQRGKIDEAREQWHSLIPTNGDGYEFWQRYYHWEMIIPHKEWSRPMAAAALRQGIQRRTLDWPEKLMEMYLMHCHACESADEVSNAIDFVHRQSKGVAKRRAREAEQAAAAYAQQQQAAVAAPAATADMAMADSPSGASKRKREDSVPRAEEGAVKKVKSEGSDAAQQLKRDRENTSVLVTGLPVEVTQTKVRQYFKEYGHINALALKTEHPPSTSATATALIEFRSVEDAQSALLRDGKYFGSNQISVQPGVGLTLYVTNYPPTADEAYLRDLFKQAGEILSIRWPSLKYNTHRRFCYISFRTQEAAAAATKLDGKLLDGKYKLEAKYSNPGQKKQREGANVEGREVHISNLDKTALEEDVKAVFDKFGPVESVRILRNMAGKSKGGAFVVFSNKDDAVKACTELNQTKFRGQIMTVEIANAVNFKPIATSGPKATLTQSTNTASSTTETTPNTNTAPITKPGDINHIINATPDPSATLAPGSSGEQTNTHALHPPAQNAAQAEISQRTIALLNVPDTVNDARLSALCSQYGPVNRLTLRPDHGGAIVEFASVADAGKAALGLEGFEIESGRKLGTGGVKDLFARSAEVRSDRIVIGTGSGPRPSGKEQAPSSVKAFVQPVAPVRRPGAGGRGGLGVKKGLGRSVVPKAEAANGEQKGGKSNKDFKAMFLAGRGESGAQQSAQQGEQQGE